MYRPCLKSTVFENQNPYMWFSKESNGTSNSRSDGSSPDCKSSNNVDQVNSMRALPIAIVEPRQMRPTATGSSGGNSSSSGSTTSTTNYSPEGITLPDTVDVNNDVMRLVSSLSAVVQILTRLTNAAAQDLRLHPEREEGFQGLSLLLNYADQMYTTLLQPQPVSSTERSPAPTRNVTAQQYSLLHQLLEPMLGNQDGVHREQEPSERQLLAIERPLAFPYSVLASTASEPTGPNAPAEIGANVNMI